MILTYIISNSREEAETIALDLIEKKRVYSLNILPDMPSMQWENDKIMKINRTIVLAKTKALLYKEVEDEVKRIQTSGTAVVFSRPITQMSQNLFDSIQKNTLKV